jgi:DEAD/DEAH box helicase domain-containing protein
MARLSLDAAAQIALSSPLWLRISNTAALTLAAAQPGYHRMTIAGLPAITNLRDVIIITHPLWVTDRARLGPELSSAWDEAERIHGLQVDPASSFVSVFEALRRPI